MSCALKRNDLAGTGFVSSSSSKVSTAVAPFTVAETTDGRVVSPVPFSAVRSATLGSAVPEESSSTAPLAGLS